MLVIDGSSEAAGKVSRWALEKASLESVVRARTYAPYEHGLSTWLVLYGVSCANLGLSAWY